MNAQAKFLILMSIIIIFSIGCKSQNGNDEGSMFESMIEEAHAAVKESLGEDYIPQMDMPKEHMEDILSVALSEIDEYIAETPMMSTHIDTFIAIDAGGNLEAVKNDLEEYRSTYVEQTTQYPMNMEKAESSKVLTINNDVYFLMLGAFDERDDATDEERLEFAKEEIEKIEDVIKKQYK